MTIPVKPNKIVSIFDDIGVKVATEMIEDETCWPLAPTPLCSLADVCAPWPEGQEGVTVHEGRPVKMVVALSPHNLKIFRKRCEILRRRGSYTVTTRTQ